MTTGQPDRFEGLRWLACLRDDETSGPHAKLTGSMLFSRSDRHGKSFPSWRRLALDTGLCRTTVRRAVAELVAGGWLEAQPRHSEEGLRDESNIYLLAFPMGLRRNPMGSPDDPMRSRHDLTWGHHTTPKYSKRTSPLSPKINLQIHHAFVDEETRRREAKARLRQQEKEWAEEDGNAVARGAK